MQNPARFRRAIMNRVEVLRSLGADVTNLDMLNNRYDYAKMKETRVGILRKMHLLVQELEDVYQPWNVEMVEA